MLEAAFVFVGLVLFSVFGTYVRWLNAGKETPVTYSILIIEAITAIFLGIIFCFVYGWGIVKEEVVYILSGLSGYYGVAAIDVLGRFLTGRIITTTINK